MPDRDGPRVKAMEIKHPSQPVDLRNSGSDGFENFFRMLGDHGAVQADVRNFTGQQNPHSLGDVILLLQFGSGGWGARPHEQSARC